MQVFVRIPHDPSGGQSAEVLQEEPLVIGRLKECGLSVSSDPYMSRRHCEITLSPPDCFLWNRSQNGTLLNQELVEESPLQDGDVIQIGKTILEVVVSDGIGKSADQIPNRKLNSAFIDIDITRQLINYSPGECDSGLEMYCGSHPNPLPALVAEALQTVFPLHLIVDLNKLEMPIPEEITQPEYLFQWLPEETRAEHTPLIVPASSNVDLFPIIREGWGKDAVIAVFSEADEEIVLKQLRTACGAYIRPSILAPQLTRSDADLARFLMSDMVAVLVETTFSDHWTLFSSEKLDESLMQLGFNCESRPTDEAS